MTVQQLIDPELALEIVRDESNPIAYDTETDGLEVVSKPVGYVITNADYSVYVPVGHGEGGNVPNGAEFEAALARAFFDRGISGYRTVGHNLGFDLRMSLKRGIVLGGRLEDTMINESLIDDTTVGYGLDDCSRRHGVTPKDGSKVYAMLAERYGGLPDKKSMQHFWKAPGDHEIIVDYATGDGISTLELWAKQQPLLAEFGIPHQMECDLLPYLARTHHRGIKIDMDHVEPTLDSIRKAIAEAKNVFPSGFNPRSSPEVEKLYRQQGFTDGQFARTDNGKVSFTEKWLAGNEIGKLIIDMRQLENCVSKFITPMSVTNNVNGRLHPVLNQSKTDEYGVAGARLSCSAPNMQAVTKRNKKMGAIVRRLVIADSDMELAEADFSQQEPRFFTYFSREPALVAGYQNNTFDIHDRASEVLSMERDKAKRLGLGMLTMMSPPTLAMHMGYSLSEARRDHSAFLDDAFPKIKEFQQLVKQRFVSRGYVQSILGRKARLSSPRYSYQGISRVIQNSGGDHMKAALLIAYRYEDQYPDDLQVLLSIHDSIIFQISKRGRAILKMCVDEMDGICLRAPFYMDIPIPMEVVIGNDWSEASYGPKVKHVRGWVEDWTGLALAA